MIEELAEMEST